MKRQFSILAFTIFLLLLLPVGAAAAEFLIPGGQVIGLQLQNGTVTVAAFDDTLGTAAQKAGVQIGDEVAAINGTPVTCVQDIRDALGARGEVVTLTLQRGGKEHKVSLTPQQTSEGPRLGLHLKQGITGIGTVSWYDPQTHAFGTLGHGVNDAKGGLLNMTAGSAFEAQILSVKKGASGEPGLLRGSADGLDACGRLLKNTPQGVFGISSQGWQGEPLPVADFEEVAPGAAVIRSTVTGAGVQEYSVEILKIYPEKRSDGRNFLLRVTDPELLSITGGIVQGMSGSTIIQNGKIVGAVTHVLVNDPTMGYGIYIGNMLDAAA